MVVLVEKQRPKSKRRRFWLSLRSLLILVTLIAVAFGIYEPVTLHFKAVHFLNINNSVRATRPHPTKLLYHIEGRGNAILCHVEQVRIVLLGRMRSGGTAGRIPIAGDTPHRSGDASVHGVVYFSYSYADGETECVVHGFPFVCHGRTIEINEQSFDVDTPTVILVGIDDQIMHTYSR